MNKIRNAIYAGFSKYRGPASIQGVLVAGVAVLLFCSFIPEAGAVTEFVSTISESGGDYSSLATWQASVQCDLTADTTKVFSISNVAGTVSDGDSVTGTASGATATVVHFSILDSHILLKDISGTFISGEQVQVDASNYVNISDTGDSAIAVARITGSWSAADTSALVIDGWTTSETNYVKIYTLSTTDARHPGTLDETDAYLLDITASANDTYGIDIREDYVRIEGLQVRLINSGGYTGCRAINITGQSATGSDVQLSYNLIKGVISGTNSEGIGIYTNDADLTAKIYNNLIYDFKNGTTANSSGINIQTGGTFYIYSNTLYGNYEGLNRSGGIITLKNNLFNGNDTSLAGTGSFDSASVSNCIEDTVSLGAFGQTADSGTADGTTTNKLVDSTQDFTATVKTGMILKNNIANTYTYVTAVDSDTQLSVNDNIFVSGQAYTIYANTYGAAAFLDEANDDFDLTIDDAVAASRGADLSADANIAVSDDIKGNSRILDGDTQDIGCNEGVVTVTSNATWAAGTYNIGELKVTNSAVLTLQGNTTAGTGVILNARNVTVDTGAQISSQGYLYKQGAGAGATQAYYSYYGGGAGYGGEGGRSTSGGIAGGPAYGSLTGPTHLGSGGGGYSSYPGSGGGAIKLIVSGTTSIDGTISANGGDGAVGSRIGGVVNARSGGGGSGGSIWIDTGTLSGSGTISANGGSGGDANSAYNYDSGGGAGGRIAIYYTTDNSSSITKTVYGGSAPGTGLAGASGTVYTKSDSQSYGNLYVNNNGQTDTGTNTPLPTGDWQFDNNTDGITNQGDVEINSASSLTLSESPVSLDGILTIAGELDIGSATSMTVGSSGNLNLATGSTFTESLTSLTVAGTFTSADELTFANLASLDVSGTVTSNFTADSLALLTVSGTMTSDFSSTGLNSLNISSGGSLTGNITAPNVGTLTLDGTLTNNSTGSITATTIIGNEIAGILTNNGSIIASNTSLTVSGTVTNSGTGTLDLSSLTSLAVSGSMTNSGTLDLSSLTSLAVSSGGSMTNTGTLTAGSLDDITLAGTLSLGGDYTSLPGTMDMTINSGGNLTHPDNTTAKTYYLDLTLANFTLNSGGTVNLNSLGYRYKAGSGAGASHSYYGGGAGYGGEGGQSVSASYPGGPIYGSLTQPVDLGSGGGGYSSNPGNGGGAVKLTVSGTTSINGTISANGGDGIKAGSVGRYVNERTGGGGSGGSIWIDTGTLSGSGTISANGGSGADGGNHYNYGSGGGAGGRIAIHYTTGDPTLITKTVYGGSAPGSGRAGASGTLYTKADSQSYGNLYVNNNGQTDAGSADTVLPTGDWQFDNNSDGITNQGEVEINSDSSLTLSDDSIEGVLTIQGTLDASSSSDLTIASGGSLVLASGATFTRDLSTFAVAGTFTSADDLTFANLTSLDVSGTMTANFTANSLTSLDVSGTMTSDFTATSLDDLTVQSGGSLTGNITAPNVGTLTVAGSLTNNETGSITAAAFAGNAVSGTLTNNGSITASNTVLNVSGDLTNSSTGTLDLSSLTSLTVSSGGSITSAGTLTAGSLTDVTLAGTLSLGGDYTSLPDTMEMTINSGGNLTHPDNTTAKTYYLDLALSNLTLNSGGSINLNAKGYRYKAGPGAGSSYSTYGGGGGYGGEGGRSQSASYPGGPTYGSETEPTDLGSGGGGYSSLPGDGGGAIKLTVSGTTSIDGTISANGEDGSEAGNYSKFRCVGDYRTGGGGSGGSIWIDTDTLSGSGTISANGGSGVDGCNYYGNHDSGGGGGGRIAIYTTINNFTGSMNRSGGAAPGSGLPGQDGTLYPPPTVVINTPSAGDKLSSLTSIEGTASTLLGSLEIPEISIKDLDNGTWLDDTGTSFTEVAENWISVTGSSIWSYTVSNSIWVSGTDYLISARVSNSLGDTGDTAYRYIHFDDTSPTASSVPTLTAETGTIIENALNDTNTNFTASATITAGTATHGYAELLKDGASFSTPIYNSATDKYKLYYSVYSADSGCYWLAYQEASNGDLPSETNLNSQELLYTGSLTDTSNRVFDPYIIRNSDNTYRVYYGYYNGSYWQLAYKDTVDTDFPNSVNMDTQSLLSVGSSGHHCLDPFVIQNSDNTYRLYYTYYNGTDYELAYRDTTDTSLPSSSNLGSQNLLDIGGAVGNRALMDKVIELDSGAYRLYYSYYNGTYYDIVYRDTIDTDLPASSNIAPAHTITGLGWSSSNQAYRMDVVRKSDSTYRIYYSYNNGTYWQLAYRDTTDTNAPTSTSSNLGTEVLLGIGTAVSDQAFGVNILYLNDRYIRSGDTTLSFDAELTSNAEVQSAFASDADLTVNLMDWASNSTESSATAINADYTKPLVSIGVSNDPAPAGAAGSLTFTLTFSEPMNTSVDPVISYDPAGDTGSQSCSGSWSDSVTFVATNDNPITVDTGDGTATISVTAAQDIAGNQMLSDTDDTFSIDSTEPAITAVSVASNNSNDTTLAKEGDTITYSVDYSEAVTVSINSASTANNISAAVTQDVSASSADSDSLVFTVSAGDNGAVTPNNIDFTITDAAGNVVDISSLGTVTGSVTADTSEPSGYTVSFDQAGINNTNQAAASFSFAGAETGTTYSYSIDDTNPSNSALTDTGTITSATQTISSLDLSSFDDDTLTLTVTLTDPSGNVGAEATDTITKDTSAPYVTAVSVVSNNANDTTLAKEADTITYSITYNEAVTASVNTVSTANNISAAVTTDVSAVSASSDSIVFTVSSGDNGAVTLSNVNFTISDVTGNTTTYGDVATLEAALGEGITGSVTADTVIPTFTVTGVSVDSGGDTVTLSFSEDMLTSTLTETILQADTFLTLDFSDNQGNTNENDITVTNASLVWNSGSEAMITLNEATDQAYIPPNKYVGITPALDSITDPAGNPLANTEVYSAMVAPESTLPVLTVEGTSVNAAGDTITITSNEVLRRSTAEDISNWTLQYDNNTEPGGEVTLTSTNASVSVDAEGKVVTITLDESVDGAYIPDGQYVKVTPSSNITDLVRNSGLSAVYSTSAVVAETDVPTFTISATSIDAASDTIELSFSEAMDTSTVSDGCSNLTISYTTNTLGDGRVNLTTTNSTVSWNTARTLATITLDEDTDRAYIPSGRYIEVTPNSSVVNDLVGNSATSTPVYTAGTVVVETVVPAITDVSPASSAEINSTQVSYTLSETCGSGTITWTQTGGTADAGSPHAQSLIESELTSGAHPDRTLDDAPTLVDGAVYTVTFSVTDLAGNVSDTVTRTSVTYDNTSPSISLVSVASNNSTDTTKAKAGDTITYSIVYSEEITASVNAASTANNISAAVTQDVSASGSATDSIVFTVSSGDNGAVTPNNINFTIADSAGNSTIITSLGDITGSVTVDTAAPTVTITPSPDPTDGEVAAGGLTLSLLFSESMDTSVNPTVTYDPVGSVPAQPCTGGTWSTTTNENDTYTVTNNNAIDANTGDGNAVISVSTAQDVIGNVMEADTDDTFLITTAVLEISGLGSTVTAGESNTITVTIKDTDGVVRTNYTGTVRFSSTDSAALLDGTALPTTYTFTSGDQGTHEFTGLNFRTTGAQTLTVADTTYDTISSTSSFTVNSGPTSYYVLTASVDEVTAGERAGYTVERYDAYGNAQTVGTEIVYLTSNSTGRYGFKDAVTAGNSINTVTFIGGQSSGEFWYEDTLKGDWTITVSDSIPADGTNGVDDDTASITVNPATASLFKLTAPDYADNIDITAGSSVSVTITAYDEYGNKATDYGGSTIGESKSLYFSGASSSTVPVTAPTAIDNINHAIDFGSETICTFLEGEASTEITLYQAETAEVTVMNAASEAAATITTADDGSLEVTVDGGTAAKLAWNTEPESVTVADAVWKPFSVSVTDDYGNVASSSTDITLVVAGGNVSVSATATETAVDGIATFYNFAVNCDSYTGTGASSTIDLYATGVGISQDTETIEDITVYREYNVTIEAIDYTSAEGLTDVTLDILDENGDSLSGYPVTGNSPFQNIALAAGEYSFNLNKSKYVEATSTKTAGYLADGADNTYDAHITWEIIVTSIAEATADYDVKAAFVYNENTDVLNLRLWLERRGKLITGDTVNALGDATISIYDDDSQEWLDDITIADPDDGIYFQQIDNVTASGGTIDLVAGNTYYAKCNISYGGIDGTARDYQTGVTFEISVAASLKEVTDQIASLTVTMADQTQEIQDIVEEEIEGAIQETVVPKITEVKEETSKILTATGEEPLSDKIEDVRDRIVEEVQPHVTSGILNHDTEIKSGDTVTISYRTATGLSPVLSVYDPTGAVKLSNKTMTESANSTGIYEYPVTFETSWGKGDFNVVCAESTKGTVDAVTITVVGSDIEDVSSSLSAVQGSTAGLNDFSDAATSMTSQLDSIESILEQIGTDIEGTGGAGGEIESDAIFAQLKNISYKIKEIADKAGGVSSSEDIISGLYEMLEGRSKDMTYLKNKTQQLKAAVELNNQMIKGIAGEPVTQIWFEFR